MWKSGFYTGYATAQCHVIMLCILLELNGVVKGDYECVLWLNANGRGKTPCRVICSACRRNSCAVLNLAASLWTANRPKIKNICTNSLRW